MGQFLATYGTLILCWLAYYSLHSILASQTVKGVTQKRIRLEGKNYRMTYSTISTLGLLAILLYSSTLPTSTFWSKSSTTIFIALVLITYGFLILRITFRAYSIKEFLGIEEETEQALQTNGPLKYVRHPIYSGTILLLAGFFIYSPTITNLVTASSSYIYLFIGIQLEERRLIARFGDAYRDYRKRTPALIPRIWKPNTQ